MARLGFSYHIMPQLGFEPTSVELYRPGTLGRTLDRLSYCATQKRMLSCYRFSTLAHLQQVRSVSINCWTIWQQFEEIHSTLFVAASLTSSSSLLLSSMTTSSSSLSSTVFLVPESDSRFPNFRSNPGFFRSEFRVFVERRDFFLASHLHRKSSSAIQNCFLLNFWLVSSERQEYSFKISCFSPLVRKFANYN